MKDASPMLVPSLDAAGSSSMPVARKETCLAQDEAPSGLALVEEDLDQRTPPLPFFLPVWRK